MQFWLWTLLVVQFLLVLETVNAKGGRGGGGRGSSGARSSGRGGWGSSRSSSGRSSSTSHGSSSWYSGGHSSSTSYYYYSSGTRTRYYDQHNPKTSCESFKSAFNTLMFKAQVNGSQPYNQPSATPVLVNNNYYYFNRASQPPQISTTNKRCSAKISDLLIDVVPFDTTDVLTNSTETRIFNETLTFTYSPATSFFDVIYENGQKATEIFWTCEVSGETCCHMACCTEDFKMSAEGIFYIIMTALIVAFCIYTLLTIIKKCREKRKLTKHQSEYYEESAPLDIIRF
ncbi:hypothetical protein M3Y97_00617100 [Aphelenchoides bicaudatus]|nr:hypothetical protein M3Y97_00617100 [Aphelenchoides bicaudatus]